MQASYRRVFEEQETKFIRRTHVSHRNRMLMFLFSGMLVSGRLRVDFLDGVVNDNRLEQIKTLIDDPPRD